MRTSSNTLFRHVLVCFLAVLWTPPIQATPDLRFEVVWFCCPCSTDNHFCQFEFDQLNAPTPNGHFLAMPTDSQRALIYVNGNLLAAYYNTLTTGWTTMSGADKAASIDSYVRANFPTTDPKPAWLVLNEISSGNWPGNASYRAWLRDVVHTLTAAYGYTVVLYSPFPNPGANDADWQAIAAEAYIAIENYLGGDEIQANGFSVSWCQSQYQSSIDSYGARGVVKSRLMLGEHFGQTTAGTGWGRSGVGTNEWVTAINIRSLAARNVAFPGYFSYAWYSNPMLAPDEDLLNFVTTYATNSLPTDNPLTPPYAILQPRTQTIPPGSSVTFSVLTAGNAALTYQWLFNGTNLAGATTTSLTLTNLTLANQGTYNVIMTNAAGWTLSSNAVLTVTSTPPYVITAPQSQTVAPGGDVAFTVVAGGSQPIAYQWSFKGTPIAGATQSSFSVSSVQLSNAGSYSVLMTNAFGTNPGASAALTVLLPGQIAFEPFGPGTTSYSPGSSLSGQVNANGQSWSQAGPSSSTKPTIAATNLTIPGLAASTGQAVQFGGNGASARFNLGPKITNGIIYFSMAVNVADLAGQTSNGVFWAAFNNSTGSQSTTPTNVAIRVVGRSAGNGFNIGLDKSFGTTQTTYSPQVFTTSDTIFLVGSYAFNSANSSDDVAQLWVNPPASTFGLDTPPAATLTNSNGADVIQIVSFVLFDRSSSEPAQILADELRVGYTWASVTPPALFIPSLAVARAGTNIILSWSTNAADFALEQAPALSNNLWTPLSGPISIIGTQYVSTNIASERQNFFRLRKP